MVRSRSALANAEVREFLVASGGGWPYGTYDRIMAYDEDLADRIRWLIGFDPALTERKMFGGLAFLIRGHLAVAASREGGVLVRVDPARADELAASTGATAAVMGGRLMTGWLRVSAADLNSDDQLEGWVKRSTEYARSLPPKKPRKKR